MDTKPSLGRRPKDGFVSCVGKSFDQKNILLSTNQNKQYSQAMLHCIALALQYSRKTLQFSISIYKTAKFWFWLLKLAFCSQIRPFLLIFNLQQVNLYKSISYLLKITFHPGGLEVCLSTLDWQEFLFPCF